MAKDRIETELRADSAQLRSEFNKAQKKVGRFTAGVKKATLVVGGLAAGAIGLRVGLSVFSELSSHFDRIGKLSNRFSMPVEDVQKLSVAAEVTGSNLEKFVAALTKATVAGVEAEQGLETYKRAFRELNIDVKSFNAAGPEKKLQLLASAFNNTKDESVAFAAAYRILGKAGGDLIPFLRQSAEGIEKLSTGLKTLDATEIKAIEDFNDEMVLLKRNLQAEIAKEFSGQLSGLEDELKAVGAALLDATRFVIQNREAIGAVIKMIVAYKALKWSYAIARDVVALANAAAKMVLLTGATTAETTAVGVNTAAHLANARARALAGVAGKGRVVGVGASLGLDAVSMVSGGGLKKGGGVLGRLFGKAMGKAAAARFGLSFLAKFSPHALAAAAGAAIGYPIGVAIANRIEEGADEATRKIQEPLHGVLKLTAMMVSEARTQLQTDEARLRIKQEMRKLEEQLLGSMSAQKREEIEYTLEVLKRRAAGADMARERAVALETERKIEKVMAGQHENALLEQKMRLEAYELAQKRLEKEKKIAQALRDQIAAAKGKIVGKQVDLLPPESRVKIFSESLKKQLADAAFSFNLSRKKGAPRRSAESIEDVYGLAQDAEKSGQLELAKALYERVQKMQETQDKLNQAKRDAKVLDEDARGIAEAAAEAMGEQARMAKEKAAAKREEVASQNESKRAIAGEIAALQLEARGRMEMAEALRAEVRLREEAKRIAEETGVSEKKALEVARKRQDLKDRVSKRKEGAGSGQRDKEGLRQRIRRERQERIEKQNGRNRLRAERDPDRWRMGLRGSALRNQRRARRERGGKSQDSASAKFDRLIGQNDELLGVWKKIVTSS